MVLNLHLLGAMLRHAELGLARIQRIGNYPKRRSTWDFEVPAQVVLIRHLGERWT